VFINPTRYYSNLSTTGMDKVGLGGGVSVKGGGGGGSYDMNLFILQAHKTVGAKHVVKKMSSWLRQQKD
jgi:hypothetical protein